MARRCSIRLFDSCISKDDAVHAKIQRLPCPRDDTIPLPPPPPHLRLAPVVSSSGMCCRRHSRGPNLAVSADFEDLPRARETPVYLWRKEEKWHVVSCGGFTPSAASAVAISPRHKFNSDDSDISVVLPPAATMPNERRRREVALRQRRRGHKKKPQRNPRLRSRPRGSSSSADANCLFSSEEDGDDDAVVVEEQDLLTSSKSNSTSDNSFDQTELRRWKAAVVDQTPPDSSPWMKQTPFLRDALPGEVDGVPSDSLAVVKQSEDPRADFRQSMAEMVVEKGIYDVADLEQLLHCFLSLNSEHHHRSIIAAFQDVWQALFPSTPFRLSPAAGHRKVVY